MTILILSFIPSLTAQVFEKQNLSEEDKSKGIREIYLNTSFEHSTRLTLYKDKKFEYGATSTNHSIYSAGSWKEKHKIIILNSELDSNDVPVKIHYRNSNALRAFYQGAQDNNVKAPLYKTKFQVPLNLKGEPIPDSRIFINNDSSYCFPFFDTCIGKVNSLEKIKIRFGSGFKTKWIELKNRSFNQLLIIGQFDVSLQDYYSMKNYKLKRSTGKLTKID